MDTSEVDIVMGSDEKQPVGVCFSLDTVQREPVSWLLRERIAYGKLTLLEGLPDLGKSALVLDLAARLTSGQPMPGETEGGPPAHVIVFCAEDEFGDTLLPRIEAAGGIAKRVHLMPYLIFEDYREPFRLPEGIAALDDLLEGTKAKLVIFDPLLAFFGTVNCFHDQHVRRGLAPLLDLAKSRRFALVALRNWTKQLQRNLLYRGAGAMSIVAASRTAMIVTDDPVDAGVKRLHVLKSNLAPKAPDWRFTLENTETAPRVRWLEEAPRFSQPLDEPGRIDKACAFLVELLRSGPLPAKAIQAKAFEAGITERNLRYARDRLGIRSKLIHEEGCWQWMLPAA